MKDKYKATLIGCGLGDSLGMAVEGWKRKQIEKYVGRVTEPIAPVLVKDNSGNLIVEDEFGKLKYYTLDLSQGDISDDTILTIAIAESILDKRCIDLGYISQKQVQEYVARIMPDGHVFGGFGKTTQDAFENIRKGISPLESGVYPGLGTGPCMKMSPVGLYMHATQAYNQGIKFSKLIGRATHLDERAVAAGVVQADIIFRLLNENLSREDFLSNIEQSCISNEEQNPADFPKSEKGTLNSRISWIRENKDVTDEEAKKVLGNSSLAIEAYPFTIFMFQKYWNNPIEGLIETVNWGGDCDTTGAMYGALCGAKNGMIFPENWKLNEKQKLAELGERFWRMKNEKLY